MARLLFGVSATDTDAKKDFAFQNVEKLSIRPKRFVAYSVDFPRRISPAFFFALALPFLLAPASIAKRPLPKFFQRRSACARPRHRERDRIERLRGRVETLRDAEDAIVARAAFVFRNQRPDDLRHFFRKE